MHSQKEENIPISNFSHTLLLKQKQGKDRIIHTQYLGVKSTGPLISGQAVISLASGEAGFLLPKLLTITTF